MQGLSGSWNGNASTSRGECAQLLYNLLGKLNPPSPNPSPTAKAWIHYKISDGTMNWMPRIHGNHVAWLGLVDNHQQAFLYDISTGVTTQITQGATWDHEYLDLQGNWVALQATDGLHSEVFLYDIAAQKLSMIANSNVEDEHPTISSGRVVWSGFDGDDWELFLYDTAIGQAKRLTNDTLDHREPQFDGSWIAHTGRRHPSVDYVTLSITNATTGGGRLLLTDANDANPQVRGNFVVWERQDPGGENDIYLHDIALNKTENLTSSVTEGVDRFPTMDGAKIVWEHWGGNDWELFLYDIAAGTTTQLTNNSFSDYSPQLTGDHLVWSADTVDPGTDVYYRHLAQPGFGSPERLIIDTLARNLFPQVHMEKVVWVRQWTEYDILMAEKVDIPIYTMSNKVPQDLGHLPPSGRSPHSDASSSN